MEMTVTIITIDIKIPKRFTIKIMRMQDCLNRVCTFRYGIHELLGHISKSASEDNVDWKFLS